MLKKVVWLLHLQQIAVFYWKQNLKLLCLQPDPHNKSKRVLVMIDPKEIERERQKAQKEEQLVLDLIGKSSRTFLLWNYFF